MLRVQVFKEESQPVIDALLETGRVAEVDAQADPEEVFQSVAAFMDKMDAQGEQGRLTPGKGTVHLKV